MTTPPPRYVRRDPAPDVRTALARLERAAATLSNHDRENARRTAGDWSRLHAAIEDARAALQEEEA